MTEPMIEARAMSSRPALIARMTITTSGRLPNVAFRSADTRGPAVFPAWSVASPRSQASAMSAIDAAPKTNSPRTAPSLQPDREPRRARSTTANNVRSRVAHRYQKDVATIA